MKTSERTNVLTVTPVEDKVQYESERLTRNLSLPVGIIMEYKGDFTDLPIGWLPWDQQLYTINDYRRLYLLLHDNGFITNETSEMFQMPGDATPTKIVKV